MTFKKPIRIDEEAEYLQFYIRKFGLNDIMVQEMIDVGTIGLYVETF